MTGPFAEAAHKLLAAGWHPLALPPGAKSPPPAGYTGAGGVDASAADVQTWIDSRPGANVAVRAPVGVLGIDVDAYGGKRGDQTLAELEAKLGPLPDTYITTARPLPSGIRWYRVPPGVYFADPGPGVEAVQRSHRYGVAPPSLHPDTGTPYRWLWADETGVLDPGTVPEAAGLPNLPDAWVQHLTRDSGPADKGPVDDADARRWWAALVEGEPCRPVREAVDKFVEDLPDAHHPAMLHATGLLARLGDQGHTGAGAALVDVRDRYVQAVTTTADHRRTEREAVGEYRRALLGAIAMQLATPTADADRGCCGLDVPEPTVLEEAPEPVEPEDPYPPVDWHSAWDLDPDDVDWLVVGLLEAQRHAALYAGHKVGKSLMMLEVAAAVAAGDPEVLGCPIPSARTVLYVDWENSPVDFVSRLKRLERTPDELDRLVYLSFPALPPLDTAEGGRHLAWVAARHNADLVVLDTFSRAVEGPENDSDTYRDYYLHTGRALKGAGIALWRLDHSGKDADRGMRGSSGKGDDVDVVWALKRRGTSGTFDLRREVTRTLHGHDHLVLHRGEEETRLRLVATEDGGDPGGVDGDDEMMRRVSDYLMAAPDRTVVGAETLRREVTGKDRDVLEARDRLIALGLVKVERTETGAMAYRLDRPFRVVADDAPPVTVVEEADNG